MPATLDLPYRVQILTGLVGLCMVGSPAPAQEPAGRSDDLVVLNRCRIDYKHDSLLGCSTSGVLQDRLIELGDAVTTGQVLGRLQDADAQAELALDRLQAESEITIRKCEAQYAEALEKLRAVETLNARDHASSYEYRIQRLQAETARMELEEAKHQQRLAQLKQQQSAALVHLREFASPHDGIVVEILKAPGEPLAIGDPVFRVVNIDLLRVTGHLDVVDAWRVQEGQTVTVRPDVPGAELPIEDERFRGHVVFVDRQVDPETRTCRVVAEVENRAGRLRAGLEAVMEIDLASPTASDPGRAPSPDSSGDTSPPAPG